MKITTRRDYSVFINIPLLWFLLAIVRWRINTAPLELEMLNEGSALLRQILSGLILAGLLVLVHRRISLRRLFRDNPWVVLLFFYMGVSVLWSAFPGISFKRWIKTFGVLVMVLVILTEENPPEAVKAIFRRFAILTLPLSLVLIHAVPSLGWRILLDEEGREMIGITQGKNSLGILALMIAVFYTWEVWTSYRQGKVKKSDAAFLGMAVYTLVISNSVTSLFSYLVFLSLMTMLSWSATNLSRNLLITVYAAVMVVVALNLFEELFIHGSFLALVFNYFGRDLSFTGRWDLWHYVLQVAGYVLILGYGYGSFWLAGPHIYYSHEQWHANEAHNGYLDVYLELGAVGLALVVAVIISGYRKIVRGYPREPVFSSFRFSVFVVILLHNMTETSLCKLNNPLWFLFLLMVVSYANPRIQPVPQTVSQGAG